MPYFAILLE